MISIQASYPLAVYILLPLCTLYCGLFLNISNHYIFRPKLMPFLQKLSISSPLVIQIFMDIVSNLSFISYSACSFFTNPVTDGSIRIVSLYSIYWLTICMAIIMYMKVPNDPNISNVVLCKNGFILGIGFVNLIYHYIANVKFITLPAILVGLYLVNLLITAYEDKFIMFVFQLLSIKQPTPLKPKKKMISHLPTIQSLSNAYPLTAAQIEEKMQGIQKQKSSKQTAKAGNLSKPIVTKIDTKILARQKLMRICVCVHLSMVKKQEDQMNALRHYYALMNGTLSDNPNIRKCRKQTNKNHKTFLNNRNKDKIAATRRSMIKNTNQPLVPIQSTSLQPQPQSQIHETTQTRLQVPNQIILSQEQQTMNMESIQSQSLLFYFFPIRIFQSSKIISLLFSVVINLGFGVLLGYCQNVMGTLQYGRFSQFVLAALLLPSIPHVGPFQFLNTLTLTTIWKLSMCGLFALFSMLSNSSDDTDITVTNWSVTPLLQYIIIIIVVLLMFVFAFVLASKNMWKLLVLAFLGTGAASGYLIYAGIP